MYSICTIRTIYKLRKNAMKNHAIIITGANSGIGYAMPQTLLESGCRVVVLYTLPI
jgi:hypothetical protein